MAGGPTSGSGGAYDRLTIAARRRAFHLVGGCYSIGLRYRFNRKKRLDPRFVGHLIDAGVLPWRSSLQNARPRMRWSGGVVSEH
jgi:hypothetical protein